MDFFAFVIFSVFQGRDVFALSGHVCTRQRAEQYLTSYNKGFICPERYTTACGQLDWRRCTKYRVQTCYTPTERYATRYVTVEECCPGWKDTGAGSCSIPVCAGRCQNGGVCVYENAMAGCKCLEGFSGELCEIERNSVDVWKVSSVGVIGLAVVVLTAVLVVFYKRTRQAPPSYTSLPQQEGRDCARTTTTAGECLQRDTLYMGVVVPNNSVTHCRPTAPVLNT